MGWVDVIICLITQMLNKNSQPTWVDTEAGRTGESAASLSGGGGDWGGEAGDLHGRLRAAGTCPAHTRRSCPLMVGEFSQGPLSAPSWSNAASSFDGVGVGHGVFMRSPKVLQPTLRRSVADGGDCLQRMKWNS